VRVYLQIASGNGEIAGGGKPGASGCRSGKAMGKALPPVFLIPVKTPFLSFYQGFP